VTVQALASANILSTKPVRALCHSQQQYDFRDAKPLIDSGIVSSWIVVTTDG